MLPRIAIIDQNTLEATGLKSMISDIVPMIDVSVFPSVEEMLSETDEMAPFVHFFVSSQVLIAQADYFLQHPHQTIVLTAQPITDHRFSRFHTLDTSQGEHDLVKTILQLHGHAHGNPHGAGFHHGSMPESAVMAPTAEISPRETEVLALVVRGFINKEIADRLCISLPTVISHRKNICEKLHLRSVSSLTIYAVTHGIVNVEDI